MAKDLTQELLDNPFWNRKLDRALRVRDADKDGRISLHDYELILKRVTQIMPAEYQTKADKYHKFLTEYCSKMGLTDPSVHYSFQETKEAIAKMAATPQRAHLANGLFYLLDLDEDGMISFDEWIYHYKSLGIYNEEHARASFESMDKNKSGKVSREDFIEFHCEFYFTAENKLNSAILYGPME